MSDRDSEDHREPARGESSGSRSSRPPRRRSLRIPVDEVPRKSTAEMASVQEAAARSSLASEARSTTAKPRAAASSSGDDAQFDGAKTYRDSMPPPVEDPSGGSPNLGNPAPPPPYAVSGALLTSGLSEEASEARHASPRADSSAVVVSRVVLVSNRSQTPAPPDMFEELDLDVPEDEVSQLAAGAREHMRSGQQSLPDPDDVRTEPAPKHPIVDDEGDLEPPLVEEEETSPKLDVSELIPADDETELAMRKSAPPPPPEKSKAAPPAPPPTARKEETTETPRAKKKSAWWEEFFNDDYLRTVPPANPKQIGRQCDFIVQRLGLKDGATILDVGCGLGLHAIELTRRGYLVVGLDLSLPMLSRAADEAQDHGFRINFLHADMREMNFEGAFDAVLCLGTTFGYFDDDQNRQVVERLYRALKPKGLLMLDVVNRDFVFRTQPNLVWFEGDGCVVMEETDANYISSRLHIKRTVILDDGRQRENVYSVRLYTLHELGQMLHQRGLRVVEVSGREATPGVFFGADSPRLIVVAERRVQQAPPSPPKKPGSSPESVDLSGEMAVAAIRSSSAEGESA